MLARILHWITKEFLGQLVWSYASIWGPALVAAAFTYLYSVRWDYVILMAAAIFALMSAGLFYFSQWQAERTPENKLQILGPRIVQVAPDPNRAPPLKGIKLGVAVQNNAKFPMEIKVLAIASKINNMVPAERNTNKGAPIRIGIGHLMFHEDNAVEFPSELKMPPVFNGDFVVEIKYGRPGNLKYSTRAAYAFLFTLDDKGLIKHVDHRILDPDELIRGEADVSWKLL
jgi:hypothetical protein